MVRKLGDCGTCKYLIHVNNPSRDFLYTYGDTVKYYCRRRAMPIHVDPPYRNVFENCEYHERKKRDYKSGPKNLPHDEIAWYLTMRWTEADIAEKYNCSAPTVHYISKKLRRRDPTLFAPRFQEMFDWLRENKPSVFRDLYEAIPRRFQRCFDALYCFKPNPRYGPRERWEET